MAAFEVLMLCDNCDTDNSASETASGFLAKLCSKKTDIDSYDHIVVENMDVPDNTNGTSVSQMNSENIPHGVALHFFPKKGFDVDTKRYDELLYIVSAEDGSVRKAITHIQGQMNNREKRTICICITDYNNDVSDETMKNIRHSLMSINKHMPDLISLQRYVSAEDTADLFHGACRFIEHGWKYMNERIISRLNAFDNKKIFYELNKELNDPDKINRIFDYREEMKGKTVGTALTEAFFKSNMWDDMCADIKKIYDDLVREICFWDLEKDTGHLLNKIEKEFRNNLIPAKMQRLIITDKYEYDKTTWSSDIKKECMGINERMGEMIKNHILEKKSIYGIK